MPMKKPAMTTAAAMTTRAEGEEDVAADETAIVNGSTSPRAIWKPRKLSRSAREQNLRSEDKLGRKRPRRSGDIGC